MRVAYRLTLAAVLAVALPAPAEDAPKSGDAPKAGSGVLNPNAGLNLHSAGQVVAKLSKADGSSVTVKMPDVEHKQNNSGGKKGKGGSQLQRVEKDHNFDLTSDAKVRWHDLPKKADG